jgi:hypothetical protein
MCAWEKRHIRPRPFFSFSCCFLKLRLGIILAIDDGTHGGMVRYRHETCAREGCSYPTHTAPRCRGAPEDAPMPTTVIAHPIHADALPRSRSDARASAQARHAAQVRAASGRRRFVDPTTCERDYSEAELEFMQAMHEYKRTSGRMFPTWSEVLEVVQGLGYEKNA